MIKTQEEIQALKESWLRDPNWDIEDTPDFEEHKDELVRWRMDVEEQHKKADAERLTRRVRVMSDETGIDHPVLADSLYTFAEIENDLKYRTAESDDATSYESAQLETMRAQVRATLLLAAQVKRVADVLDNLQADDTTDFMTNLYKMDR